MDIIDRLQETSATCAIVIHPGKVEGKRNHGEREALLEEAAAEIFRLRGELTAAKARTSDVHSDEDWPAPWCPRCQREYVQDAPGAARWTHPFSESGCRYSGSAVVVSRRAEAPTNCDSGLPGDDRGFPTLEDEFGAVPARVGECSPHPDAPHGFDRQESHNQDRYVCDCESWQPPQPGCGGQP